MANTRRVLLVKLADEDLAPYYRGVQQSLSASQRNSEHFQTEEGTTQVFKAPTDAGIDLVMPMSHVCPPGMVTKLPLGISIAAYDISTWCGGTPLSPRPGVTVEEWTPITTFLVVRSSTGTKTPLRQANAPGVIDQGYRGIVMGAVDNISDAPFRAEQGTRYFQIIACDGVSFDELRVLETLPAAVRNQRGFGSTGQ
jgi:dUTPase